MTHTMAEIIQWPKATGDDIKDGWTLDPKFLKTVLKRCQPNIDASREDIEEVLQAAAVVLAARDPVK